MHSADHHLSNALSSVAQERQNKQRVDDTRRPNNSSYRSRYSRSRSRSYDSPPPRRSYRRRSRSPLAPQQSGDRTRPNPPKCRCLGVFGLNVYTTKDQILEIFQKFGPVERVQVVFDAKTGRSRGYCFVYFEHVEDAKVAMEQCTGMELNSRTIRVDYSMTKRAHTPTPGIYKGRTLRHRIEPADTLLASHQQRRTRLRSSSASRSRSRERRSSRRGQSHSRSSRRPRRHHEVAGEDDDEYYYRRSGRSSSRDRRSISSYEYRTRTRSSRRSQDRRATHSRSISRTSRDDRRYR